LVDSEIVESAAVKKVCGPNNMADVTGAWK